MKRFLLWLMVLTFAIALLGCKAQDESNLLFSSSSAILLPQAEEPKDPSAPKELSSPKETPTDSQDPIKEEPAPQNPIINAPTPPQETLPTKKPLINIETEEPKETEKSYLVIHNDYWPTTKEILIQKADLILSGKILKKEREYMSNPDETLCDNAGEKIPNAQVAEYTVEIETLYKGTYESSVITVKTVNGSGLSPDLILYGEDEKTILKYPLDRLDLDEGKDCILFLQNVTDSHEHANGYRLFCGTQGYYLLNESGMYTCAKRHNSIGFSLETIQEEIETVLNS